MADLSALTPEQVKALADLAEIAKVDPTLAKVVGALASLGGVVITILVHINNLRTKKNTAAHEAVTKLIDDPETGLKKKIDSSVDEVRELVKEARDLVADFRASVETARNQFSEESRQYKLRVMELKKDADRGLSLIPKIQDQIEKLGKQNLETAFRVERHKEEQQQFETWLRDQVRKRQGGT